MANIQELARIGAAVRIKELEEEIENIRKSFPGLVSKILVVRRKPGLPKAQSVEATAPVKRQRRKMSAAARKAIGDAQRKRWAEKKAGAKK